MKIIAGIDIGGTKCAITFAQVEEKGTFRFLDKVKEQTIRDNVPLPLPRWRRREPSGFWIR